MITTRRFRRVLRFKPSRPRAAALPASACSCTGAGGFIGSHLAERLAHEGAEVHAMVHYNALSSWGNLALVAPAVKPELRVTLGNIEDSDVEMHACRGMDVVLHLAALIAIPYSYVAPRSYVRTNGESTLNVLEAARQLRETFFVINGDLLTTLDFAAMLAAHRGAGADATVGSFRREVKSEFGILDTDDAMRMAGYREKPVQTHLVSMGLYVLQRDAVTQHVAPGRKLDMPDLMRAMVADGRHVLCHAPECFWLDIGRPEDYAEAQAIFARDRTLFLPDEA